MLLRSRSTVGVLLVGLALAGTVTAQAAPAPSRAQPAAAPVRQWPAGTLPPSPGSVAQPGAAVPSTSPAAAPLVSAAIDSPSSGSVSVHGVYQDTNYNCVPASSAVSLSSFGVTVSQDTLATKMGTTTSGTHDTTALPVVNGYIIPLGYSMWDIDTTGDPNHLLNDVAYDVSVLKRAPKLGVWMEKLPWNAGLAGHFGHAIVADGYNRTAGTITVWDPWRPTGGAHTLSVATLNAAMQVGGLSYIAGHSDADLTDAGDLTGDGRPDMIAVNRPDGGLYLYAGQGGTSFAGGSNAKRIGTGWNAMTNLAGVGDLTGDRHPDLVAVEKSTGKLWLYRGPLLSGTTRTQVGTGWGSMRELTGIGNVTGDGHPDLLAIDSAGRLWLYPGKAGGFGTRKEVAGGWSHMASLVAIGDLSGDGKPDLAAVDTTTGKLWLYRGPGFAATSRVLIGGSGWNGMRSLAGFGDLTGDKHPDLVAVANSTGALYVYPGRVIGLGTRTQIGSGWNI